MQIIKRNRAQCPNCGDIIESISKHNIVACSCYKASNGMTGLYVEGGTDKLLRGGPARWTCTDLSDWYEGTENDK